MPPLAAFVALGVAVTSISAVAAPGASTALDVLGQRIADTGCSSLSRTTAREAKNPNDPDGNYQYLVTHCGGIKIVRYLAKSHEPPLKLLYSVVLSQDHPLLPRHLRIGASLSEVVAFAGEPHARTSDRLVYHLNDEGPGTSVANFVFRRGRLLSIAWSWHVE